MNKLYIKPLRLMQNIGQKELAEATGYSERTIWGMENGDPKAIELVLRVARLCRVLGCGIEDLVELEGD